MNHSGLPKLALFCHVLPELALFRPSCFDLHVSIDMYNIVKDMCFCQKSRTTKRLWQSWPLRLPNCCPPEVVRSFQHIHVSEKTRLLAKLIMHAYIYIYIYIYIYVYIMLKKQASSKPGHWGSPLWGEVRKLGHRTTGYSVETHESLAKRAYALSSYALTCQLGCKEPKYCIHCHV